tara:strand:- start:237 stop:554 length:318 start_codon:yes stop_codon:yes gene_type:complete
MRFFKIFIILYSSLFLFSCGTVKEGFKNQKKENSDEFLVEKKSPLVMPPDYNDLPVPNTNQEQIQNSDNNIKELIITDQDNTNDPNLNTTDKNLEESLLEKIKNN